MVAPNIFGVSVQNLVHVTLLIYRSFKWFLHFWKIYAPLAYSFFMGYTYLWLYTILSTCNYLINIFSQTEVPNFISSSRSLTVVLLKCETFQIISQLLVYI